MKLWRFATAGVGVITVMTHLGTSSPTWAQPAPSNQTVPPNQFAPSSSTAEPGYLGVIADRTVDRSTGILVREVFAGGPAAAAGLRPGDVITSIDGKTTTTVDDMASLLAGRPAGDDITFVLRRGNAVHRAEVRLGQRPPPGMRPVENFGPITPTNPAGTATVGTATPGGTLREGGPIVSGPAPAPQVRTLTPTPTQPANSESLPHPGSPSVANPPLGSFRPAPIAPAVAPTQGGALLGIRAVPLNKDMQRVLNVPDTRGALIVEVRPGTPAHQAGLPLEAVVTAIDGVPIESPQQLAAAVNERGAGATVRLSYFRFGQLMEKTVRLGGAAPDGAAAMPSPPPPATAIQGPANRSPPPMPKPPTTESAPVATSIAPPPAPKLTTEAEAEAEAVRREIDRLKSRLAELEATKSTKPSVGKP